MHRLLAAVGALNYLSTAWKYQVEAITGTMPLQDTSADADEFSTLEDIIDFSDGGINGGSVNQITPQPCSNSTITTSNTQLGNERFASNVQKEQLPALRGTSLDSDAYLEGLCVPWDEIPELGWLSQNDFVNECSFSSLAAADIDTTDGLNIMGSRKDDLDIIHVNDCDENKYRFQNQSGSPISVLKEEVATSNHFVNKGVPSTPSHVPGRIRSKRKRSEACLWNTRILASNQSEADALSSSSLIRSCNSSASSYDLNAFFHDYDEEEEEHASMQPSKAKSSSTLAVSNHHQAKLSAKKAESVQKIRSFRPTTAPSTTTDYYYYYCDDDINDRSRVSMRKCSHCGSQTTPQWRAGPMGPKTLCNACGVRYKSGRLLPEYRPAASPTFQESLHSNSHRRVLEMHISNKLAAGAGAGADRVSVAARPPLLGTTGHQLSIIGHHAWAPSSQQAYIPPP